MKMELNIGKNHLYIASVIIALLALVVFAAGASKNPGHSYEQIDMALAPITIDQTSNKVTIGGHLVVTGDFEGKLSGAAEDLTGTDNSGFSGTSYANGCMKVVSIRQPDTWDTCPTGFFISAIGTKYGGGILAGDPVGSELNPAYFVIFLCCPLPGY